MVPVPEGFFRSKDPITLARDLLGKYLVHETPEGIVSGVIVETEAYLRNDPACHASRGKTARNASMFDISGKAYVYFIYGMYHCFNVVASEKGIGEAVLIRALEPACGIPIMQKRRPVIRLNQLANGPGKLCLALGIDKRHDGSELWRTPLYIAEGNVVPDEEIEVTKRIGVSEAKEADLRFLIKGNAFISRKL